jgi:hypothetical protein
VYGIAVHSSTERVVPAGRNASPTVNASSGSARIVPPTTIGITVIHMNRSVSLPMRRTSPGCDIAACDTSGYTAMQRLWGRIRTMSRIR